MGVKRTNLRDCLNAGVFIAVVGILFALNLVIKPPSVLVGERRLPAPMPAFSVKAAASGSFMRKFEDYAADCFVFRDGFRALKAAMVFGPYMQTDKSGLYFGKAGAGEFKPPDPVSVRQSVEKIKKAAGAGLLRGCRVYYSLIPEKSLYAGRYYPGLDLESVERILAGALEGLTYIPLADCLSADSFYRTDLHWDQCAIGGVVSRLGAAMEVRCDVSGYSQRTAGSFRGVYAGQLALPIAPDVMRYMELPGLQAKRLNDSTLQFEECPVYDMGRFEGVDPYDMFLQGPQAIVVLENPGSDGGELFLFRDSYGSSLAPLLAGAYRKITLIDLRYIDFQVLDQFIVCPPGADALFLYSAQILNNPSVLKI